MKFEKNVDEILNESKTTTFELDTKVNYRGRGLDQYISSELDLISSNVSSLLGYGCKVSIKGDAIVCEFSNSAIEKLIDEGYTTRKIGSNFRQAVVEIMNNKYGRVRKYWPFIFDRKIKIK
jgi:hypothetical protein